MHDAPQENQAEVVQPGMGSSSDRRVLVLIPTYNERENLPLLAGELLALDPRLDLLIIDDASPDGTGAVADSLAASTERIRVIHRLGKLGQGSAYIRGFQTALHSGHPLVVQMDADLSHRPKDLTELLAAAEAADLVIGSRNIPGGRVENYSWPRRLLSRFGSWYARAILGIGPRDYTSGFKCFRLEAIQSLDLDKIRSNGYAFHVEVNYACARAGLRVLEVPIVFPDRVRGSSKMSMRIAFEAAVMVLRLRSGSAPVALPDSAVLSSAR